MHKKIKTAVEKDLKVLKFTLDTVGQGKQYKFVVSCISQAFPDRDNPKVNKSFEDVYKEIRSAIGDSFCNNSECYQAVCDITMWMLGINPSYSGIVLRDSDIAPGQEVYDQLLHVIGDMS